jgi:NTP pyrophosphatase (non-canonical NTP hydrolase)
MTLNELIELQKSFDERHGWRIASTDRERLEFISRDIVGILGEIGEFANQFKKIQLVDYDAELASRELRMRHPQLSEELVDTLIYLVRLAGHLGVDIERAYTDKLKLNAKKYSSFAGSKKI